MDHVKGKNLSREMQGTEQQQSKSKRRNKSLGKLVAKLLFIPFLLFFSLVVGLVIGYSVIGKQPGVEVFDLSTYKHMYDLIFSGT